jgi:hypothetical protein
MAQLVVFLAAQQDAGKDVVNFSAVFICQAITTSAKKSGLRSNRRVRPSLQTDRTAQHRHALQIAG